MERQEISRIAHRDHPIAAPLSDEAVRTLLDRLLRDRPAGRLLDLGCGEAPWLLRALAARPALRGVGADPDPEALRAAQRAARLLGVDRRIGLHHGGVREFTASEPFDAVLCVGPTPALGGPGPALAAIGPLLAPGGTALLGTAYREGGGPPGPSDGGLPDLAGTLAAVRAAGWLPVAGHTSSRAELDAYAWARTGALADWALDQPPGPDREQALRVADGWRERWPGSRGGGAGFVTMVLRQGS
ncbi:MULTISPECIES: class I SAM-dependent methyltransferase [Kitasatospora]|uniref:Methyltransferase domain-containing protein n=1 Tax=Kitasatospora setae (strain ATCC 33774 / DSM 43861 / JCM 3304 / KCC A-0304 / NBRC 14216 / KM-6054) TaxID=452652 RepID=E4N8C9_KITSK|nr:MULTISPECIES: class I SAM-dependent methyltransferase [Kitasatospora]BAJ27460.1 hypothetical protein KSE_16350 [Kitasatospora setae KM-6054]